MTEVTYVKTRKYQGIIQLQLTKRLIENTKYILDKIEKYIINIIKEENIYLKLLCGKI